MFAVLVAMASEARAQHSDVLLVNLGGQVGIGSALDIDGPDEAFSLAPAAVEVILRVGFAPPTPADYESDEPGFFALHAVDDASDLAALGATALPSGATASASLAPFAVAGNVDLVFFWNGAGAVDFQPIATAQPDVAFAFNPAAFATTGSSGDLDGHPIYQLNRAGGGAPADGVYLVAATIGVAGLTASDRVYMVLLADALITGEDELELVEHALEEFENGAPDALVDFGGGVTKDFSFYEEAVEWVEGNLVVPEPASGLIATLTLLGAVAARRNTASRSCLK